MNRLQTSKSAADSLEYEISALQQTLADLIEELSMRIRRTVSNPTVQKTLVFMFLFFILKTVLFPGKSHQIAKELQRLRLQNKKLLLQNALLRRHFPE